METVDMDVDALDLPTLLADASQFSSIPGVPSDAATKHFLDRYPLPVLFSALETGMELENAILISLEKIFNTPFGASSLLQSLPYAGSGLAATSASTRRMTCLGISKLLESGQDDEAIVHALIGNNLVFPMLKAIADGDAAVASAAAGAVGNLAKTSAGRDLLFVEKGAAAQYLQELATHGSSLVRIRIFSIIAFLLQHTQKAASVIKDSGILRSLEAELNNTSDVLAQMNALELLYEIAVTPDGAGFLIEGGFIHQLLSIMGNNRLDPLVHSQSIEVGARLISPQGPISSSLRKEDAMRIIDIIDTTVSNLEDSESIEKGAAIDALGRIGISKQGAELLFESSPPVARHVVRDAFTRKGGGQQLVAVHALASIAGSERTGDLLLSEQAEASLKNLIFLELERLSKWSLSGFILWLLQQARERRLAAYRLIIPMVARLWFLLAICSNKDIIDFLINPQIETTKEGMEWRHACCAAVSSALATSGYRMDAFLQELLEKLQAAVKRGPFLAREKPEAQPLVVTQERF